MQDATPLNSRLIGSGSLLACECCGSTTRALTFKMSNVESECLCEFCQGLIDAGLVRPERDEAGRKVYRQWHFEWTPGKLVGE